MVRASGSRSAEFNVSYEFDIFRQDNSENLRVDVLDTNNQIGVFPAAIENFQVTINETNDFFLFDNLNGDNAVVIGSPSFVGAEADIIDPVTLDLTARFIPAETVITDPDGVPLLNSNSVIPDEFSLDDLSFATTTGDRIEYTLTSVELLNLGINGLTLVVEDGGEIPPLLDTNLDPILDENGVPIRPNGIIIDFDNIDVEGAVNDIDSIINQEIFGKVTEIRVSGPSLDDPTTRIFSSGIQTVNVEPSPEVGEPLLIEAEDLNLVNLDGVYHVETIGSGEDSFEVISLRNSSNFGAEVVTGEARLNLGSDQGEVDISGNYDLTISTFDENDGSGTIEVLVDGERRGDLITLDEHSSNGFPNEDIRREFTFGLGELQGDEEIIIQGTSNEYEFVRLDFITFTEVI